MTRAIFIGLVATVLTASSHSFGASRDRATAQLQKGIDQVQEGLFDAAVVTLDGVVNELVNDPSRTYDLARAHVYLGVAYVGLDQRQKAKGHFVLAWRVDNSLRLSHDDFPPSIVKLYEETREETEAIEGKAKRSKWPFIVGGGVLAAGATVGVVAATGSDGPSGYCGECSQIPDCLEGLYCWVEEHYADGVRRCLSEEDNQWLLTGVDPALCPLERPACGTTLRNSTCLRLSRR